MYIYATLGREEHTTSKGWTVLYINDKKVTYRDANTTEWLTEFKDKHASWCECTFAVKEGDVVVWEAGTNSGNRGASRCRCNLKFVVDPKAEIFETEDLGYPAKGHVLKGRLRLVEDANEVKAQAHQKAKEDL